MLGIPVLKLLHLPCLWEFLISLFTSALQVPKMLFGILRNSSNLLSPLFFKIPFHLPYTSSEPTLYDEEKFSFSALG